MNFRSCKSDKLCPENHASRMKAHKLMFASKIRNSIAMNFIFRITVLVCLLVWLGQSALAVELTFKVDMSELIEEGGFDPGTEFVDLAGDFNGWGTNVLMMEDPESDSVWEVSVDGFAAGQVIEFKFRINALWSGREEFPGVGRNRSLTVPGQNSTLAFVYNRLDWNPASGPKDTTELSWWNDAIFYEIFVRSFYDSDGDGIGDFSGLTQKLDYLNDGDPNTSTDLGVTALWLMPIHPSPSYHGYDVTDYKGINPDFGTMADFQAFLDAAHARGIRVIIDYVMNHSSSQHPWFIDSRSGPTADKRNWYRWTSSDPGYNGPWGQPVWHNWGQNFFYGLFWSGMPDLNYEEPAVKAAMFESATYWLDTVGVDGFRLDAVKYIYEDGSTLENTPETFTFFQDFRQHYSPTAPDAVMVGEAWTTTSNVIPYVEDDRLDFCFEFDLSYEILGAVNAQDANGLQAQIQRVYDSYPYLQWGTFLSNHDQNRVMEVVGDDSEAAKLAASLYLTLPGVPFLYYGEEVGMNGAKPDPDIRRPMQWSAGPQAGFSQGTPWRPLNANYTSRNVQTQQGDPQSIWNRYQRLIQVRQQSPALRRGYLEGLTVDNPQVMAFMRYWEGDTVWVVANLGSQPTGALSIGSEQARDMPEILYEQLSESSLTPTQPSANQWAHPPLDAREVRIYRMVEGATSTPSVKELTQPILFPNPATDRVWLRGLPTEAGLTYTWYDVHGRQLQAGVTAAGAGEVELWLPHQGGKLLCLEVSSDWERYHFSVRRQ